MNRIADYIEKNYQIFFVLIILIAFVINIYQIGKVPNTVNCDEAGMAYDAYAIANYGVDRFLNRFPVYFINFGGGQNALYTYLTALIIKIVGNYNNAIIRIPALILSMGEVIVSYLLVNKFRSKKEALLFMLLITISPWHIMKSRWGLESNLLSPMLMFSIFAFIKAVLDEKYKNMKFIVAGVLFGLTLYSYALSYIIVPVLLGLIIIYFKRCKKISIKEIGLLFFPIILLALPLILMIFVQKGWISEIKTFFTIPKLFEYRVSEINIKDIFHNLSSLRYVFFSDYLSYNSINEFGTLYYFGTIFMIIGIVITIYEIIKNKKHQIDLNVLMIFIFLSNIILALLIHLNTNKLNGIFVSAIYFEMVPIKYLYKKSQILFEGMILLYLLFFIAFSSTYFHKFSDYQHAFWDNGIIDLVKYLEPYQDREIHIENANYIYELYANPISPFEFYDSIHGDKVNIRGYTNYYNEEINIDSCNIENIYITQNEKKATELKNKYDFQVEKFKDVFYILSYQ